jgi:hypothetical protein
MTHEDAKNLKSFQKLCNCGGYAWSMNGRSESQPHMEWCPQFQEYKEWWSALHGKDKQERKDERSKQARTATGH